MRARSFYCPLIVKNTQNSLESCRIITDTVKKNEKKQTKKPKERQKQ